MYSLKQKILLSLLAGVAFGCAITPKRQWRVLETIGEIWSDSDNKLGKEINNLNRSKLIKKITAKDGTSTIKLTEKGKLLATEYCFLKNLKIRDKKWDGRWRILIFDVPEKLRKGRNALRWKIRKLGFCELQKSVFVIPYECKKEIDFIVNYFSLGLYVHYGILEIIGEDVNSRLKKVFKLE
jgi:DNA-binding transcriptional regulator PaaX